MDPNLTLLWLAVTMSAVGVVQLLLTRPVGFGGALVGPLVSLAVAAVAYLQAPAEAGYWAAGATAVLTLGPGLLGLGIQRAMNRERYATARLLTRFSAVLSPTPLRIALIEHTRLLEAITTGQLGPEDTAPAATDLLGRIRHALCLRVAGDWQALRDFHQGLPEALRQREPGLGMMAIGAYGHLGEHDAMVALCRELEARRDLAARIPDVRLVVAAHLGEVALTDRIANRSARSLPRCSRDFWRALSRVRAGQVAAADAMRPLLDAPLRGIRKAAEREAAREPQPPAPAVHGAEVRAYLAELRRDLDSADGLSGPPSPHPATGAVLAGIALFQLRVVARGNADGLALLDLGGLLVPAAEGYDQPYRLLTAAFLHAGALHLLLNGVAIWALGRRLETIIGTWRTLSVFVGASLVGNLVALLTMRGPVLVVGASGGALGLAGALGVVMWQRYRSLGPTPYLRRVLVLVVIASLPQVLFESVMPNIASTVHIAGLLGGALTMWLLSINRATAPTAPAAVDVRD